MQTALLNDNREALLTRICDPRFVGASGFLGKYENMKPKVKPSTRSWAYIVVISSSLVQNSM
jgi:hypothetical protein